MLDDLVAVIETLKARIQQHQGSLQSNEIRTRTALIDPLLAVLGWVVSDPGLVTPEYDVSGKRADYALLDGKGGVFVFLEAKRLGEQLSNHQSQVVAYASELGIRYPALTNGDDWEVYDNSQLVPIDQRRILKVSITSSASATCALQLLLLWRANVGTGQVTQANQSIVEKADPPTTPPPPPLGNWIPLGAFQAVSGTKPPPAIRFPNGDERQATTWRSLLVETAEWLIRRGYLTQSTCPIKMGAKRYGVHTEAIHSDGTPFAAGASLSNGLFVETSLNAPATVRYSCSLLKTLGQDPSTVLLKTD
jgi:hypothetical protein